MSSDRSKLVSILKKLKKLSECHTGNQNETAAAAAKMFRLMAEHDITLSELEGEDFKPETIEGKTEFTSDFVKTEIWQVNLFCGICRVNCCQGYTKQHNVNYRRSKYFIVGTPSDIENVRTLFEFCVRETQNLERFFAETINSTLTPSGKRKVLNDYKLGAAAGIVSKLNSEFLKLRMEAEKAKRKADNGTALVLFENKATALAEAMSALAVKIVGRAGGGRRIDPEAYHKGVRDGSALVGQKHRLGEQKKLAAKA